MQPILKCQLDVSFRSSHNISAWSKPSSGGVLASAGQAGYLLMSLGLMTSKGHLPALHWLAYHLKQHDKTNKSNIQLMFILSHTLLFHDICIAFVSLYYYDTLKTERDIYEKAATSHIPTVLAVISHFFAGGPPLGQH